MRLIFLNNHVAPHQEYTGNKKAVYFPGSSFEHLIKLRGLAICNQRKIERDKKKSKKNHYYLQTEV